MRYYVTNPRGIGPGTVPKGFTAMKNFDRETYCDMMVICSHDNGYTYGSLSMWAEIREEHDGEFETVEEICY